MFNKIIYNCTFCQKPKKSHAHLQECAYVQDTLY